MTSSKDFNRSFQFWVEMIHHNVFDLNRFCWTEAAWEYIYTPPEWVVDITHFKDDLVAMFSPKMVTVY